MSIRWAKRVRSVSELESAREAGFGHVQLPVGAVMEWEDDSAFEQERRRLLATGLSFATFESPLPKGVRVTEPGFNIYSWTEYLNVAIRRAAGLGCGTLVWGEGRARLLPIEGETAALKETLNQFVYALSGIAERNGIVVCVEPLGPRRTNFLNSIREVRDFLGLIGKSNLALAVSPRDLFEMDLDSRELLTNKDLLRHVHIEHPAVAEISKAPRRGDGWDYAPFVSALRDADYEGTIALPFDADSASLAYCADLWAR